MAHERASRRKIACGWRIAALALLFIAGSDCRAQTAGAANPFADAWSRDLKQYPGLPVELSVLAAKLQQNKVQFPAPRHESPLLPLLPKSTFSYIAFSNYGDTVDQALKVFHEELAESSLLRDWWAHGETAKFGAKAEQSLEQFAEISQYIGGEVVVSTQMKGDTPKFLAVAQIRKPGLRKILEQRIQSWGGTKAGVRVLGPEDLPAKEPEGARSETVILVRPDLLIAAGDMPTLKEFVAQLDAGSKEFSSTGFGQRMAQEYRDGVTVLAAADLHRIVSTASPSGVPSAPFRQSGFADMQYLVWAHKTLDGKPASQMELSFTGPRHGAASWLANSNSLGSLDFVSPKAAMAATVDLSDPLKIYDDAQELARLSGSNTFATVPQFERMLNLSLKDDLLGLLGGELTVELDTAEAPKWVQWKVFAQVKDAGHLQRTLNALIGPLTFSATQADDGVTYHGLRVPTGKTMTEVDYAFADNYLIAGSSQRAVSEAVDVHRSGGSLAKSKSFLAALPPQPVPGPLKASALIYEDPVAIAAAELHSVAPSLAGAVMRSNQTGSAVVCVYGENSDIREVSVNPGFDMAGVLVVAAVAIPNLLRSRIAANEVSAVGSLRTIVTAQIVYASTYSKKGFASNLAALGPDERGPGAAASPEHSGLLDESLANSACAGEGWCTKAGYNFRVTGVCQRLKCNDFVAVASPVSPNTTGTRSFCATSDGVLHYTMAGSGGAPPSVEECRAWPPLQ